MASGKFSVSTLATVVGLGGICAVTLGVLFVSRRRGTAKATDSEDAMEPTTRDLVDNTEPGELSLNPAPAGSKALVVCSDKHEDGGRAAGWAAASRGQGATVSVAPPEYLATHKNGSGREAYDWVVIEDATVAPGEALLEEVLQLLKAGGKAVVAAKNECLVKPGMTLAGFMDVAEGKGFVSGTKAMWQTGASAAVSLPSRGKAALEDPRVPMVAASKGADPGDKKTTWKVALSLEDDLEGMADDLVDEDALLEASAPVKRVTEDAGGCATKRRACKDCSCGRAEMEQGLADADASVVGDGGTIPTSSCGSCYKGDAFRCATCPFLGKPAFEKGQEKGKHTILLSQSGDASTRTYHEFPAIHLAMECVTKLYEARLKEINPSRTHIQYDVLDLLGFIDGLTDLSVLVFEPATKSYVPHGKEWIKQASYSYLQQLAGQ